MPSLRLFVSEETQARLDAAAPSYGGRAALLRVLLKRELARLDPLPAPKGRLLRTFVRLTPDETQAVVAHAASRGLKASTWIRVLVRRRLFGEPRFLRSEELALYAIHDRLSDIGRQLSRLNAHDIASAEEEPASETALLDATRAEIRIAIEGLRRAFRGNLAYWAPTSEGEASDGV